jgi:type II secretory pathway component HofQ
VQKPHVSTYTLETLLDIPDGRTAVLCGGKTDVAKCSVNSLPIQRGLPNCGRVFNMRLNGEGQQLLILVTPRIIVNEPEERIFLGILDRIAR